MIKDFKTLLYITGLHEFSDEQIALAAKNWRKVQHRNWKRKYREERQTISMVLDGKEYSQLKRAAAKHKMPLATFLKTATIKYLEKGFILHEKEELHTMIRLLRNATGNINGIAKRIHTFKDISKADMDALKHTIKNLETDIREQLTHPPLAASFLKDELSKNPSLRDLLLQLLEKS